VKTFGKPWVIISCVGWTKKNMAAVESDHVESIEVKTSLRTPKRPLSYGFKGTNVFKSQSREDKKKEANQ